MAGISLSELKAAARKITGQTRRRGAHEQYGLGRNQINRIKKKKIYRKGDQVAIPEIYDRMERTKRVRGYVRKAQRSNPEGRVRKVSAYSKLIGQIMRDDGVDLKYAHKLAKSEYGYVKQPKARKSRARKEGEPRKPKKRRKRKS